MVKSTTAPSDEDQEEDSALRTTEEELDSEEEQPEESEEEGGETLDSNDSDLEDSEDGAPEEDDEEDDPLKKAKKHADRKITELGTKLSQTNSKLVEAVKRSPELLIEMYDDKSDLYDRDLAQRITAEFPDVYAKANEIFKAKMMQRGAPAQQNPAKPDPEEYIKRQVAMLMATHTAEVEARTALDAFRKKLGYSLDDFAKIEPGLKSLSDSIRRIEPEVTHEDSYTRAFLAMFPGDYERGVKNKTLVNVSKKLALETQGGGAANSKLKKVKISDQDREAAKVANLSVERYLELQKKYKS